MTSFVKQDNKSCHWSDEHKTNFELSLFFLPKCIFLVLSMKSHNFNPFFFLFFRKQDIIPLNNFARG